MSRPQASMLTPLETKESDESCPKVDLPLPPKDSSAACAENSAYLNFANNVEKGVGKSVLKVGIKVDTALIDIIGSVSGLVVNGVAVTAAYSALMLTFPDLDQKVEKYRKEAEAGWEAAQAKSMSQLEDEGFAAGYVSYFIPPSKAQQKWIEKTKELETRLEKTNNPFVRVFARATHEAQGAIPTRAQVEKGVIRGTAKAITVAAQATTAVVKGAAKVVTDTLNAATDSAYSEQPEYTAEEKIQKTGGYLDALSSVGDFFNARHEYFNKTIPFYLQWIGPLAPYAILGSLMPVDSFGFGFGGIIAAAWPLLKQAAAWTIQGSQVVSNVKETAAIDSVKFVLTKFHELLKSTKIPASDYSDVVARFIVAVSCPAWSVRESDEKMFSKPDRNTVSPFLYFWRYAAYAYCLDPKTLKASDVAECNELNKQFSKRYYIIMDNVKGVEGLKKHLVNFFLVYDLTISCFVASFQGTTTLDDVLIDAFGQPYPLEYTDKTTNAKTVSGHAHETMLKVAQNCVALILAKLRKDHSFYLRIPIITTGHSLGAGVAAISALLFRQEGFQAYCMGIATPACLSPTLTEACQDYVVSIVNNADIVPRLSECALFNLSSSERVCTKSQVTKLVCPGNVFWMREADDADETGILQEIVQLRANNPFATTILARLDCLIAHGTSSYLNSLKAVDPTADVDAIDLDFSLLFPKLPERKLEPEFLMLYLPPNVAKAMKSCINKRESAKVQRAERRKDQQTDEQKKKSVDEFAKLRKEFQETRDEMLKQYSIVKTERDALALRLKQIESVEPSQR